VQIDYSVNHKLYHERYTQGEPFSYNCFLFLTGCGQPRYAQSRVIGGNNANSNSWPWQIVLYSNGRAGCGGSIISPNWIVTAAHCVVDQRTGRTQSAYAFQVG